MAMDENKWRVVGAEVWWPDSCAYGGAPCRVGEEIWPCAQSEHVGAGEKVDKVSERGHGKARWGGGFKNGNFHLFVK